MQYIQESTSLLAFGHLRHRGYMAANSLDEETTTGKVTTCVSSTVTLPVDAYEMRPIFRDDLETCSAKREISGELPAEQIPMLAPETGETEKESGFVRRYLQYCLDFWQWVKERLAASYTGLKNFFSVFSSTSSLERKLTPHSPLSPLDAAKAAKKAARTLSPDERCAGRFNELVKPWRDDALRLEIAEKNALSLLDVRGWELTQVEVKNLALFLHWLLQSVEYKSAKRPLVGQVVDFLHLLKKGNRDLRAKCLEIMISKYDLIYCLEAEHINAVMLKLNDIELEIKLHNYRQMKVSREEILKFAKALLSYQIVKKQAEAKCCELTNLGKDFYSPTIYLSFQSRLPVGLLPVSTRHMDIIPGTGAELVTKVDVGRANKEATLKSQVPEDDLLQFLATFSNS